MTLTIGDVLAVIASVLGAAVTLWALLIGGALIFEKRAARACDVLEQSAGSAIGLGAAIALTGGALGLALVNQNNGLLKLIGFALSLTLLGTAAIGGAGLTLLLGERISRNVAPADPVLSLARAAGLLVAAGFTPLLGWFLVAPVAFLASLGAGSRAVFRPLPTLVAAPVSGAGTGSAP